ncbi:MAG TPA: hypothetical protein VI454_02315 [Verrucomicrobiae bacterium]|jgi:hypothetical protein
MESPSDESRRARRILFVVVMLFLAMNAAIIWKVVTGKPAEPATAQTPARSVTQ